MIEVHIEDRWQERLMEIYIYERGQYGDMRLFQPNEEGRLVSIDIPSGDIFPSPTFLLKPEMLKALVEAGLKITPPNTAMQNHLEDAIKVRDRLLTLVEKTMPVHEFMCKVK